MKSIINILNEALAKDVKIPQKAYADFENALSDTSKVFDEELRKNHWNTLIPKRQGNWLLPALILPILIRLTVFMEGQWEIPFSGNLPKNMPK